MDKLWEKNMKKKFYILSHGRIESDPELDPDPKPDPDPLARGTDPGMDPDPDPHQNITDPQYW